MIRNRYRSNLPPKGGGRVRARCRGDEPRRRPLVMRRKRRRASQSQEGRSGREAGRSLHGQALKGEPRERARLKNTGEIIAGARRRGTQEVRGRNMTRAGKVRERWLALIGLRCGGRNLGRARRRHGRRRIPGSDSEAGRKPEDGIAIRLHGLRLRSADHEVDEPRGGSAQPIRRQDERKPSRG